MLRVFLPSGECLTEFERVQLKTYADPLWVDLISPTKTEVRLIERLFGVHTPTRDDLEEIEQSSRLYQENDSLYMTVVVPIDQKIGEIQLEPLTFIVSKLALITVRYTDIPLLDQCAEKPAKNRFNEGSDQHTFSPFSSLLHMIVDSIADLLEKAISEVEAISKELFHRSELTLPAPFAKKNNRRDLSKILYRIGLQGEAIASLRDSLTSHARLLGYLSKKRESKSIAIDEAGLLILEKDVSSLNDHALFISNKITFLLEATLGLINIEQNMIIKTFSVGSLVFLPPTLLASIWGMNYTYMPELAMPFGYPLALCSIALSSMIPYCYFRKKGWL